MASTLALFRALHILFAILWAGAAIHMVRIHLPLLRSPDNGYALRFYGSGKHETWMAATSTATVGFGGLVLAMNDGGYGSDIIGMGGAALMGLGMTAAVVAYGLGVFMHRPNARTLRLAAHDIQAGNEAGTPAFAALVAKDGKLSMISTGLVAAAMVCMVTFRLFG